MPRARGACAPPRGNTDLRIAHLAFPQSPVSLARDTGLPARAGIVGARPRAWVGSAPTIRAFRPPRSLSRVSERGLWGNANVGRILAGSRRWNPAMSSRTHSPATLRGSRPPTRVPGTAVFGCAEPCWDRPWQKVERPSTPTSGQKPRLRHASGRGPRRSALVARASAFSQRRDSAAACVTGSRRRTLLRTKCGGDGERPKTAPQAGEWACGARICGFA